MKLGVFTLGLHVLTVVFAIIPLVTYWASYDGHEVGKLFGDVNLGSSTGQTIRVTSVLCLVFVALGTVAAMMGVICLRNKAGVVTSVLNVGTALDVIAAICGAIAFGIAHAK